MKSLATSTMLSDVLIGLENVLHYSIHILQISAMVWPQIQGVVATPRGQIPDLALLITSYKELRDPVADPNEFLWLPVVLAWFGICPLLHIIVRVGRICPFGVRFTFF